MEKHDEFFTPGQVDQQIESVSRGANDDRDTATNHEASTRLLLDLSRAYRQQARVHQDALGRVLDRLLQHEAQSSSPSSHAPQERKPHMEHPISGPTPRNTLAQRLGLLAAAALLILLVGSMAVVINLAHQQKEITGRQGTTRTGTVATAQSNLYVAYGKTVEKLNSKSGEVLWSFTAPGYVFAPVTIANGVVYVVPQDNAVFALNATNGKLLWQTQVKHFSGSVAVAQGTVYASSPDYNALFALNASNGQIRWQRQLGVAVVAMFANSSIVYASTTIVSPSGPTHAALYALNASNGAVIWHTTFSDQSFINTPRLVDGILYVSSTVDNKEANPPDRHSYISAFDAKTGNLRWRSIEIKAYVGDAPMVANNTVYVGSNALGTGGPSVYAFRASDGSLVWKKPVNNSVDSCLLVGSGVLYAAEGTSSSSVETPVLALDAGNGSVRWSHPLTNYFEYEYRDCALNDGLLYILTDDGLIHVLQATDGTQVSRYDIGNAHFLMPAPTLVMAP